MEITWHMVVMIVVTILILREIIFGKDDGLDFTFFGWMLVIVLLWVIYGGVFLW